MKVQCPECREIVPMTEFSTSAEGLRFKCAECGRTHFLDNPDNLDADSGQAERSVSPATDVTASSPDPDERLCPKCGHTQSGGPACNKCGLDFLRFDPDNLPPDPPEAAEIWAQVLEAPSDDARHERFIHACNNAGRLDYATRQYRILSREPGMGAVAERMRVRIVSLAQAQLANPALDAGPSDAPKRTRRVAMWIMLILAMGGLAYLIYSSSEMLKKLY